MAYTFAFDMLGVAERSWRLPRTFEQNVLHGGTSYRRMHQLEMDRLAFRRVLMSRELHIETVGRFRRSDTDGPYPVDQLIVPGLGITRGNL